MKLKFWVLERSPIFNPEWFSKHYKKPVTNILYGDRYRSKEEAESNAPDGSWKPRLVDWFEVYGRGKNSRNTIS